MLVSLLKESQSSFLGVVDIQSIQQEGEMLLEAGLEANGFTIDVPYSPESGAVLAPILLSWRNARPTRSVTLTFEDNTVTEIASYSVAGLEWVLPLVRHISIVDLEAPDEAIRPDAS